jgi:serine kinase of HPr protein (carbohydrate metabolism regulator)
VRTPRHPTVHASAVLVERRAVLIRGPSGAGKSRLAFDLILAARAGQIPHTVLVGDDRIHLAARDGGLVATPAAELAGLIEIRGLGIRRCEYAGEALVGLVVDLAAPDAARLPPTEALRTRIHGVKIPRIPVGADYSALPLVVAALTTTSGSVPGSLASDCAKEIGNHMMPSIATD